MSDQHQAGGRARSSDAAELRNAEITEAEVKPLHLEADEVAPVDLSKKEPSEGTREDMNGGNQTVETNSVQKRDQISKYPRPSSAKGSSTTPPRGSIKTSYKAVKVTCPRPGSNATARIQAHDELMRMESRRRSEIVMQIEMHQDRWQTAKEILDHAPDSVERAERLVNGFTKASEIFASQLRAISEDKFIDTNGGVAATWKAQNRLTKQRDFSDAIDILSPIASAISECQITTAKQAEALKNNSNEVIRHVLRQLRDLESSIQISTRTLKIQGGAILAEMKQADNDVKTAWDIFDGLVSNDLIEQSTHGDSLHGSIHSSMHGGKMLNGFMDIIEQSTHGGSLHGIMHANMHGAGIRGSSMHGEVGLRRSSVGRKATMKRKGGGDDCWLMAQFYKIAARKQVLTMTATKEKMEKLIDKIIILEKKRISSLRSLLRAGFLQRQYSLFLAFPSYNEKKLKELQDLSIDDNSLDAFLDGRSLKRLKHSQSHRSSIMNRRSVLTGVSESLEILNSMEEFGDPFEDLSQILSSKVVEMRKPGGLYMMDSEWTTALIIVSKGGIFHVLQTPREKKITMESSPVQALQSFRPDMDFGSHTSWKGRSKFQLLQSLTPLLSLELSRCIFKNSSLQRREIEVLVTGEQKTRNILFGTSATVKCYIRLKSPMVAKAFADALKSTKISIGATNQ